MITCLAIGDPHIRRENIIGSEEMIDKIVEKVEETEPDFVVNLGDTLHNHSIMDIPSRCLAVDMFTRIAKIKPLYVIIGNHDRINNSDFLTDLHPFPGEKYIPNVYIISKPEIHIIKGKKFMFIPYVYKGRFMEAINTLTDDLSDISAIFCHQEFYGVNMKSHKSDKGDKWDELLPYIITGHVHEYQIINGNIHYTGTPRHQEHGDDTKKTISLFTFNQEKKPTEVRYKLKLTKRKTIYLEATKLSDDFQPPEGYILRIVIRGSQTEVKIAMKHQKVLQLIKDGINVDYKVTYNEKKYYSKKKKDYEETLKCNAKKDKRMYRQLNKILQSI